MTGGIVRYTRVAVALHWTIAAIIISELIVGMFMERIANGAIRGPVVQAHASFGLTVLALSLFRLVWRLSHRPPEYDPRMAPWERRLAHGVSALLYLMMIAMPLIGWSIFTTSEHMLKVGSYWFWTIRYPPLPFYPGLGYPYLKTVHDRFVLLHTIGGFVMIGLLVLHIAGAVKHQWFDGHGSLRRMWFGAA